MSQEIIERLNKLLEAERAGVQTADYLAQVITNREIKEGMKKVLSDEGTCCKGLYDAIIAYGGTPSNIAGDFADKIKATEGEKEKLILLNKGQGWVVKKVDELLGMVDKESVISFLKKMKEEHIANISWLDEKLK